MLPPIRYEGPVTLVSRPVDVEPACDWLARDGVLGFDTATRPAFKVGEVHPVALLQLAAAEHVFLFQLSRIDRYEPLRALLEAPHIVKAGVALVAEGRQLFPQMTVLENLERGGWLVHKGERARRLEQAFVDFPRLRDRTQQRAGTMSGGEQQMVAVARAMMSAPRLLMLDEPSLGLAPRMVDELLGMARRIADGGTTVLMVEQNVKKALAVTDRGYAGLQ